MSKKKKKEFPPFYVANLLFVKFIIRLTGKLNMAFKNSDHVLLFYSVNESRKFQGIAKMMTPIGEQMTI